MKKGIRFAALLLSVMLLLCSCDGTAGAENTTAPAAQPTVPEPTVPAQITTETALRAALDAGGRVVLSGDIQLTQALAVKGNVLDGGGHTITGMKYVEGDATTENAVMITSGTVQNLTVVGSYRCLGDCADYPQNQDVRIKNVTADGFPHALSVGRGNRKGSLYVESCTLLGWSIVNRLETAQFTNCTFGWNSRGNGGHFRAYVDTELIGCRFEPKVDENGNQTRYNINFNKKTSGVTLLLEDCYVGDTLITQDNVKTLLKVTAYTNNVVVHNTIN